MRLAYFRTAIVRTPSQIKRLAAFGFVILAFSVPTLALGDIQQVTGDDFRTLVKQGDKCVHRGEFIEAEKVYKRASEISPTNSAVRLKLAMVHLKQRHLSEAYDLSFAIAKAEPTNSNAFAVLGATLLSAGKFREARTIFINALKLNKKEALAWAGYGMLDFYENRILDSLSSLQEAVFFAPNESDYYFALAQVSARAERYKEAADAYLQILSAFAKYGRRPACTHQGPDRISPVPRTKANALRNSGRSRDIGSARDRRQSARHRTTS
jgi:tetratricopeptide (TPR) repeat protein